MEAAKNTVKNFVSKHGHHDTHVEEEVAPAVTSETVKPHVHDETVEARDREVHQHHYHTTVQPVTDKQVLPEKHHHNQLPVEEREFVHGNTDKVRSGVEAEIGQFKDTSVTSPTTHTTAQAPSVTGEHTHHHVHETVQPVIHRETVQPEVIHTTKPIHEVHHVEAKHHGLSTLPTKTLDEFASTGGALKGQGVRTEDYEGKPRPYNSELQQQASSTRV